MNDDDIIVKKIKLALKIDKNYNKTYNQNIKQYIYRNLLTNIETALSKIDRYTNAIINVDKLTVNIGKVTNLTQFQ